MNTIPAEHKKWIDEATYDQLLGRWRNAPLGDPMFQGPSGTYYANTMQRRRAEVGPAAHTAASKRIGWDGPQHKTT